MLVDASLVYERNQADSGDIEAMIRMAERCLHARGVPHNPTKALDYLCPILEEGNFEGHEILLMHLLFRKGLCHYYLDDIQSARDTWTLAYREMIWLPMHKWDILALKTLVTFMEEHGGGVPAPWEEY